MALPEKPFSRKEQYLAKIAGEDTEIPEKPFSREEMYLDAIAQGGGGGGGTSNFNDLENRPQLNGAAMTGNTNITNFTGTDGANAGAQGLVPAPAAADADKFLKGDGTWDTAGGGGDSVYSPVQTSDVNGLGAVYIGSKNSSNEVVPDPSTTDNHYKYFWALPGSTTRKPVNGTINIMGGLGSIGDNSVCLGATSVGSASIGIGTAANASGTYSVALGYGASTSNYSIALGCFAYNTRNGEVWVGSNVTPFSYKSSGNRIIGGVYDGEQLNDAATVNQLSSLISVINSALGTNIVINNGVISNGNANNASQNSSSSAEPSPDDPSAPDDPGGEPGPEEEAGPEDMEAPAEG